MRNYKAAQQALLRPHSTPGWGPKALGPEEGAVNSEERVSRRTNHSDNQRASGQNHWLGALGACGPHVVGGFRAEADALYHIEF